MELTNSPTNYLDIRDWSESKVALPTAINKRCKDLNESKTGHPDALVVTLKQFNDIANYYGMTESEDNVTGRLYFTDKQFVMEVLVNDN